MTPLRARWAMLKRVVQCCLGLHEYATHLQDAVAAKDASGDTPAQPAQPAIIRQLCLHCGHMTKGWTQEGPRYAYSKGMERPDKGLMIHNVRLARCPCRDCDRKRVIEARAARRANRKVQPIRKVG